MFSGIIEELGTIKKIIKENTNLTFSIQSKSIIKQLNIGNSVSINGICQTVTQIKNDIFNFTAIKETQNITNLRYYRPNDLVNLENAAQFNQNNSGHFVTGHIDGTGKIARIINQDGSKIIFVNTSKDLINFIVRKGSIAIDGVSLTVADIINNSIKIGIIPHTTENTIIKYYQPGTLVNIETDIISKYINKSLLQSSSIINKNFLLENGYL